MEHLLRPLSHFLFCLGRHYVSSFERYLPTGLSTFVLAAGSLMTDFDIEEALDAGGMPTTTLGCEFTSAAVS
jgi:hypothetical protein